jgi:hypothetical protein
VRSPRPDNPRRVFCAVLRAGVRSDVAKEIAEHVRIIRGRALAKGIDSAPTAGKARIAPS